MAGIDLVITVTTTQAVILGSNPARRYVLLVNDGNEIIYLGMGKPAEVNRGIRLNSGGGNYEINLTNPFFESIHAIAAANTSPLAVTER